jgi:hypothetical protein
MTSSADSPGRCRRRARPPGPQLRPPRFRATVGVEDHDHGSPGPPGRLEGVVYEEFARGVEAARGPVAVEGADHVVAVQDQGHPRCLRASYSNTAAATETFKESTAPSIGTETAPSQPSRTSRLTPRPSLPSTSATGPERSSSVWGVPPTSAA